MDHGGILEPLLSVERAEIGYGDVIAVWDVSLALYVGSVTLIQGANGAGKTTTLSAIAGLLPVRSGSLRFKGQDLTVMQAYERAHLGICYVQEGHRIFEPLTVEQNLIVALEGIGLSRRASREKLQEIYSLFPMLAKFRQRRSGLLSGGQQQLLTLAQAFGVGPSLLLLDEPSAGLAPQVIDECIEWIRQMKERGTTMIIVEQRPELVEHICDEVLTMDNGRLIDVHRTAT